MITAIVQVETFGVASRKTGNKSVPDPAQHTTDPWSIHKLAGDETCRMDLGSVNAPPPLDHRQSGVGWSKFQASSSLE